ncbi:hypothetical protein DFP72DRAFT_627986 [Ephemerocybe angulata]|uniref:BTB domain-containing protein n=1 Tax=Ephemerocybe angulata TaxID=980116 RepID=A0A8H6ICC4_9AGAR|nr:hypothetical protein DFP72DRAFT_627986 [Tulosesus angulatus]
MVLRNPQQPLDPEPEPTPGPSSNTTSNGSANCAPGVTLTGPLGPQRLATGLRPAGSSSTLASLVSQSQHSRRVKSIKSMATLHPPETKFSSLKYGDKDELGKAAIIDAQTGAQLTRHKHLWFDDGSVICRAENTLFCVHMSVLQRHSEFFQDMFAIPQPAPGLSDSLVIEGSVMRHSPQLIPVITLFDKAEDVAHLLNALYDIGPVSSNSAFGDNGDEDFRVVSGILRLATKYIIDELREMALVHLSVAWPSTLKAWDLREDIARNYEIASGCPAAHRYPHPFAVINLAREVDAPSLLFSAFYDLSRYSYSQIYEPHEEDPLYRPSPFTPPSLSPADIARLCIGKEHTQHTITTLIQAMGNGQHIRQAGQQLMSGQYSLLRRSPSSSGAICISAAACRKDFTELVELATQHYLFDRERGCYDPLYVAEELGQLKSAEISECKACAKSLETWAAREREKAWKLIPVWFRLDSA